MAWRSVRQHPVRFGMSVIVVVLGIAFVTGTFSLRAMMSSTFGNIVDSAYAGQAYVRGTLVDESAAANSMMDPAAGRTKVPMDLATSIDAIDGVDVAIPDVSGTLILIKADGTAAAAGGSPTLALGLDPRDPTLKLGAGKRPSGPDEIALDTETLERTALQVGSKTQIIVGGQLKDVTVSGELQFGTASAGANLVGLDLDTATQYFAPDGTVSLISVFSSSPEADTVAAVTSALAGDGVEVVAGQTVRDESTASVETMLGFVSTFLLVFALVALVVGGFIIANTFTMIVRQRLREIAVLRAIGASPVQVFASVVGQAAIVGLIGSALGIGGGVALVYGLRAVMGNFGMNLSGEVPLDVSTVVIAIVTGVAVCVISAAIPARQGSRVAPVDAMRESVSIKEKALRLRGILGGLLMVAGVAAVVASTRVDSGGSLLGAGGAALLVGLLVVAPAITRPVTRLLALPLKHWSRPIGPLAADNVMRNPRRTAATAGALMIGLALVGAASVLAASAEKSVASLVDTGFKADFVVVSADYMAGVPGEVVDKLAAAPGVAGADPLYYSFFDVDGESGQVLAFDRTLVQDSIETTVISGSLDGFTGDGALVLEDVAKDKGWQVGTRIPVSVLDASNQPVEETVKIAAIIDAGSLGGAVFVTTDWFTANVPASSRIIDSVYIRAEAGTDLTALRAELTEVVKPYVVLTVMDKDDLTTYIADQIQQVLVILYALLGLSIVIAILGIVNTLALSIMERTREIGLLRAVGMGRLQLSGVVVAESILISVFGAIGGLAVGVGVASAMPSVFDTSGFDQLAIPWGALGAMIGLAAIVGLVAAIWPAVRAARLPVLDALSYE
ncbi:FtsX-like permease family protein [Rarobacter faecitabidus]|nr:FtsX-like permease family protein [Rarobacter faecitabidus]